MIKESSLNIPKVPAPFATFLLRIPLAVMFLQQGLSKFPVNEVTAEAFGLPFIVWWFVAYGEVGSAFGLIVGGVFGILFTKGLLSELADLLTRFSGITMTCVVTGVIWIMMPDSLIDVITRDYLHVSLYVGGLYFALRGNAKYGL
jgi:putative oxidoreductase